MRSQARTVMLMLALVSSKATADSLDRVLWAARTHKINPRKNMPVWFDWKKVDRGFGFFQKHPRSVGNTIGEASLVSTFACRDIEPVLFLTGRLPNDFEQRIGETAGWINRLLKRTLDPHKFESDNFLTAFELGCLHREISADLPVERLGWNPRERLVMNQQAFSFVLMSFAWQPIETLIAKKEIDPGRDRDEIDGWLELWCTYGYAMGVEEDLLPHDSKAARALVRRMRLLQYRRGDEPLFPGMSVLLKNEIAHIERTSELRGAKNPHAAAVAALTGEIARSPGLSRALGLGGTRRETTRALLRL